MSCTICGYGFPIADGDAVTLDFEKAKEFLKKHVGSFGQTDEEMQILDALEHAESEDAEEDELEDVMYDIEESFEDEETGDTGFGAVLAVIMRRETGINFKFYAAENDLGTPPAILWVPMYPWMLNEKEKVLWKAIYIISVGSIWMNWKSITTRRRWSWNIILKQDIDIFNQIKYHIVKRIIFLVCIVSGSDGT